MSDTTSDIPNQEFLDEPAAPPVPSDSDDLDIPGFLLCSQPAPQPIARALDVKQQLLSLLTKEHFEDNGIPVAASKLVAHQLTPQANGGALCVRLGTEALHRLNSGGRDWADWCLVLEALGAGRHVAMLESKSNKARGYKYNQAFSRWLRCHEAFQTIDKADRKRMFDILDNLPAIEKWRAGLPAAQRFKRNYPSTVLREWRKSLVLGPRQRHSEKRLSGEEEPTPAAPAELTPLQLCAQIEKLGLPRFRQQILPALPWASSLTNTALSLASPERLIETLEHRIPATNKSARKQLRELKKALGQPPVIEGTLVH